jgi:hypothetical protein
MWVQLPIQCFPDGYSTAIAFGSDLTAVASADAITEANRVPVGTVASHRDIGRLRV